MYQDKSLNCIDCTSSFTFSKEDQEFYARQGFTNEPKRCKQCRDKRKKANDARSSSADGRAFFDVTCASCGKAAQVPFNPVNGKPVYCRDCYQERRGQQQQRV